MHLFEGKSCTILYNSDLSRVLIRKVDPLHDIAIEIEAFDLLDFVGQQLGTKLVNILDTRSGAELLYELFGQRIVAITENTPDNPNRVSKT